MKIDDASISNQLIIGLSANFLEIMRKNPLVNATENTVCENLLRGKSGGCQTLLVAQKWASKERMKFRT